MLLLAVMKKLLLNMMLNKDHNHKETGIKMTNNYIYRMISEIEERIPAYESTS